MIFRFDMLDDFAAPIDFEDSFLMGKIQRFIRNTDTLYMTACRIQLSVAGNDGIKRSSAMDKLNQHQRYKQQKFLHLITPF